MLHKITNNNQLPICCIIMASGLGSRFGSNKLMATLNKQPVISYILHTTGKLPLWQRLVVTRSEELALFCRQQKVACIKHNSPYQSDTIKNALSYLKKYPEFNICQGLLFCVADQPMLTNKTIFELCNAFLSDTSYIYRICSNNKVGNPILFPRKYIPELMRLPQDKGGSYLAKKYPEQVRLVHVQDNIELFDIDTKNDLQKLERLFIFGQKNI